jgi:hypothetical protein
MDEWIPLKKLLRNSYRLPPPETPATGAGLARAKDKPGAHRREAEP